MLIVKCPDRLEAVRKFADTLGDDIRAQFEDRIAYLEHFRNDTCEAHLYVDFAPHSFLFDIMGPTKSDGSRERWFHGGLIYYGPSESGVSGPQYSVNLDPQKKPHWRVNT